MSDTIVETKTRKPKVTKVKVDKYNGFKVPAKSRTSTKWAIHIYDMIKEAKPTLLENEPVKDAYNKLIECLIKYEGTIESWIPTKYHKYAVGIKPRNNSYGVDMQCLPVRWTYSWQQQNDPIIRQEIKEKSQDIYGKLHN